MAIANKITPNAFLKICTPAVPKSFSMRSVFFKTAYTKRTFTIIPTMMFCSIYSARKDNNVVNEPAPAINGNANGTMESVSGISSLKKLTPRTISIAIINITNDPAMAKDDISRPMMFNISSPRKRNEIMMSNETQLAFADCMCPDFLRNSIIMGIEPKISMIANRIIVTDNISLKLKKSNILNNLFIVE